MPLTIKLDEKQMQELRDQHAEQVKASKDLSDNLSKWLALLVKTFGGEDENVQAQIDENAARIHAAREKLQTSINNQTKETE